MWGSRWSGPLGIVRAKHTIPLVFLSISNPNMLWSCMCVYLSLSLSCTSSQVVFLWLIGMQWSFRASHPHTKLIDIEIWLCKWASCLLLLVLWFFFWVQALPPPHLLQPHLIVRSVQILLGFCVVGTCSHENYFTLSVDVCERFFNYTDLILFFSICKMVGSRVFFQNLFF
jgi:hypothetical protein